MYVYGLDELAVLVQNLKSHYLLRLCAGEEKGVIHVLVLRICRTQLVAHLTIQLLVGRTLELHEVDQSLCWGEIDEVHNDVRIPI